MANRPDTLRSSIGAHLRRTRQALGWTLDDVVDRVARDGLRLSRSTLHRIETGKTSLPVDAVASLSRVMGLSLGYLEDVIRASETREFIDTGDATFESLLDRGLSLASSGDAPRALRLFEAALDRSRLEDDLDDAARDDRTATALIHVAECHRRLRHHRLSLEAAGRVLNLRYCSDDNRLRAILLHVTVGYMTDDLRWAEIFGEYAERLLGHASDPVRAYGLYVLGNLSYKQGRPLDAITRYESARPLYEEMGSDLQLARLDVTLGHALFLAGRADDGLARVRDGQKRAARHGFREVSIYALRTLGLIETARGDDAAARFHFEEAASLARRLGLSHELFLSWHGVWEAARRAGDAESERWARRVLRRLLKKIHPDLHEARAFVAALADGREADG